jgi:tetratricopeptide (TPR) repeat protein
MSLHHLAPKDGIPRAEYVDRSNREAERALALDGNLAEAHLALASNYQYSDWNWAAAEQHFRRAVALRPRLAATHHMYAKMLYPLGRLGEALREIDEAARLDPTDRTLLVARGVILKLAGRLDEAVTQERNVVSVDPAHSNAYLELSCAYEAAGKFREAIDAAEHVVGLTNRESFALSQLGHLYALSGRNKEAADIRDELEMRFHQARASACEVAGVYAGWHDVEKTLEWLARGVPAHDTVLTILSTSPQFRFLRGDSRFHALLSQVHLE